MSTWEQWVLWTSDKPSFLGEMGVQALPLLVLESHLPYSLICTWGSLLAVLRQRVMLGNQARDGHMQGKHPPNCFGSRPLCCCISPKVSFLSVPLGISGA